MKKKDRHCKRIRAQFKTTSTVWWNRNDSSAVRVFLCNYGEL